MSNHVTRKELAEVIGEQTLHIKDKSKLTKAIAGYLSTERRPVDLGSLTRDVMQYRVEKGYVEAVAISAHELTPLVLKDIDVMLREHFPDAKHIIIDSRIDQSLVGGVRIELPQETLDLSVRSKLNMFKRLVAEERN